MMDDALMPDCGVHYLWFAFVCFLIRSHPPMFGPCPCAAIQEDLRGTGVGGRGVGLGDLPGPQDATPPYPWPSAPHSCPRPGMSIGAEGARRENLLRAWDR